MIGHVWDISVLFLLFKYSTKRDVLIQAPCVIRCKMWVRRIINLFFLIFFAILHLVHFSPTTPTFAFVICLIWGILLIRGVARAQSKTVPSLLLHPPLPFPYPPLYPFPPILCPLFPFHPSPTSRGRTRLIQLRDLGTVKRILVHS